MRAAVLVRDEAVVGGVALFEELLELRNRLGLLRGLNRAGWQQPLHQREQQGSQKRAQPVLEGLAQTVFKLHLRCPR